MDNLRKELERELINLEIEADEDITVKLVTKKFKRKALKVHSDKTGLGDDEEFKQLYFDFEKVRDAVKKITADIENEEDKSDLQTFFEAHNVAKEFSKSWTIFVEKEKVREWKKELESKYPDPKELQGKGTQYKASVENKIVFTTFYDVEVPKMNIQGNHEAIRIFVLSVIPENKNVRQSFQKIDQGENIAITDKQSLASDNNFVCNVCGKAYIRKFAFDKHIHQHTQSFDNQKRIPINDRSKENCPTCKLPKTRGKGISCKKCQVNFHIDCVVGTRESTDAYKSGRADYECEDCFLGIDTQPDTNNEKQIEGPERYLENSESLNETLCFNCANCDFTTMEENDLTNHIKMQHKYDCEICKLQCKSESDLRKHLSEANTVIDLVTQENSDDESGAIEHLRKKCEYLEEVLNKEQKVNSENIKARKEHEDTIKYLKKEVEKADERTRVENIKVREVNEELVKLKEKINKEIIENLNKSKLIEELKEKMNHTNSGQTESEEIRRIKEKAMEFKATNELKIKKMKEKHLEDMNEVQIKKIRVEEELRSAIKEKQKLKESERILLETFDTLKAYYGKSNDQEINCDKCRYTCRSKEELSIHKKEEHAIEYSCKKCANKFETYNMLQEHISLHEEADKRAVHECGICGIKGSSEQYMEKHIESMHTCVECETLFDDVYELNRHKESIHTKEFKCNLCNFSTKDLIEIKEHYKIHDVFNHCCELCGKEDNSESKMEEHIRNEHMDEILKRFKQSRNKTVYRATASKKEKIKFSKYERKSNGICSYWRRGKCTFGEFCRFSHDDPPMCVYGRFCNRKQTCRFSHFDEYEKTHFLGQTHRHSNRV